MPGQPIIIIGNPQHDRLRRLLPHGSGKRTHFLAPLPPIDLDHRQARAASAEAMNGYWALDVPESKVAPNNVASKSRNEL